jgi:FAD/FMN-containing dehydrogenase
MFITVDRQDPRYDALLRGHNIRFPASAAVAPGRIELCTSASEAAAALQRAISDGVRPTVRSGGHCYENFSANNPGGVLIDLSLMDAVGTDPSSGQYFIGPGAMLGDVYKSLYKRYGLTLPAGSCYTVGSGGHISGGGYGLLSRLQGLSSDWLTAVDILTVDSGGKVRERRVNAKQDADLFRACRGAGGAGFGIITNFYFDKLPPAPVEVANASLQFPWETMSEGQFTDLLITFGDYWTGRGRDPDTWGLFALLEVGARERGRLGVHAQFCQPDGTARDLTVLHEFFDRFQRFSPVITVSARPSTGKSAADLQTRDLTRRVVPSPYDVDISPWLEATIGGSGSGSGTRAKYKSSYMKRTFVPAEASAIFRFYSSGSLAARSSVISMDSYGGAINRPELVAQTAMPQRSSIMKLQWQCYWHEAAEDADHLRQLDAFYTSIYTGPHVDAGHQGTPWGEAYEGCYMNYPDIDMLRYEFWPQLFYGSGDLYPFLQKVKQQYDPNNIFHHSMSVRPA